LLKTSVPKYSEDLNTGQINTGYIQNLDKFVSGFQMVIVGQLTLDQLTFSSENRTGSLFSKLDHFTKKNFYTFCVYIKWSRLVNHLKTGPVQGKLCGL
jgi:hypothetical protein